MEISIFIKLNTVRFVIILKVINTEPKVTYNYTLMISGGSGQREFGSFSGEPLYKNIF